MVFLDRLYGLLNERGITKNKLLTDLKLGRNSFVNWESRGTVPSGDIIIKIADYFQVSIDYLLGKTDKKERPAPKIGDELYGEEARLLQWFRAASPDMQEAILNMLRAAVQAREGQDHSNKDDISEKIK